MHAHLHGDGFVCMTIAGKEFNNLSASLFFMCILPYSLSVHLASTILKIIQGIRNTQSYLRPSYPQRREYTSCEANEIVWIANACKHRQLHIVCAIIRIQSQSTISAKQLDAFCESGIFFLFVSENSNLIFVIHSIVFEQKFKFCLVYFQLLTPNMCNIIQICNYY